MDFGEFLGGIRTVDLVLFIYFVGFLVLGFAQGTLRRLIGIGSILFSFFFAANLAEPLGVFLGNNWTQFERSSGLVAAAGGGLVGQGAVLQPADACR